jgi:hypothetical protein
MTNNKKKPIPTCVLCKYKLEQIEEYLYKCSNPKCKKEYTLFYEVMAYDDSVGTAYDEEANTLELEGLAGAAGPRLEVENDYDYFDKEDNEDDKPGSIPIPKYMKNSETTKVIEYREG